MEKNNKNTWIDRKFADEDAALDYIAKLKWEDDKFLCSHCFRYTNLSKLQGRKAYSCQNCGTQYYPLAGTKLENSKLDVRDWLKVVFMYTASGADISPTQIQEYVGVSYKTAWNMSRQVKSLLYSNPHQLYS
jgi:transposase-like protein